MEAFDDREARSHLPDASCEGRTIDHPGRDRHILGNDAVWCAREIKRNTAGKAGVDAAKAKLGWAHASLGPSILRSLRSASSVMSRAPQTFTVLSEPSLILLYIVE
jgi:hypothetical protein